MPFTQEYPHLYLGTPTPTDPGKYVLLVTKPGAMVMGGTTVSFFVDYLVQAGDGLSAYFRGYVGSTLVVQFPAATPWLLLERERVSVMTPEQAHETRKAMEKRYDALTPADDQPQAMAAEFAGAGRSTYL